VVTEVEADLVEATGVVLAVMEAVGTEVVSAEAKVDTEAVDLEVAVDLEEAVDLEVAVDSEEVTAVMEDIENMDEYKLLKVCT
jgi:ribosome maturation factor RimP